jgi:hypothetical protein
MKPAKTKQAYTIAPLLDTLNSIHSLSTALKEALTEITEVIIVPKKHLLLKAGEQPNHYFFVLSGLLRSYYLTEEKEITNRIATGGQLLISGRGYYEQKPGKEFIETMQNSVLAVINYYQELRLINKFSDFGNIKKVLAERHLLENEQYLEIIQYGSLPERIRKFNNLYPGLNRQLSDGQLASLINMSRRSYCRHKNAALK